MNVYQTTPIIKQNSPDQPSPYNKSQKQTARLVLISHCVFFIHTWQPRALLKCLNKSTRQRHLFHQTLFLLCMTRHSRFDLRSACALWIPGLVLLVCFARPSRKFLFKWNRRRVLNHSEGSGSNLHLNGGLSEYFSFSLRPRRTLTEVRELIQKSARLSCVRTGAKRRRIETNAQIKVLRTSQQQCL